MKARVSRRQNESCHTCNKKTPSFDLSKVWPLQQNSYHQCMLYDQMCTLNICTFYIHTARLNKAFNNFMKRNVASDAWALLKCTMHLSSQCTAWTNIKKPTWLILLHRLSGSLHWNQGSYPNGKVVQQDSLCFSYSMQPLHRSLLAYGLSVPFHIREVSMQAYKITVCEMNCSRIAQRKNLLQDEKKKLSLGQKFPGENYAYHHVWTAKALQFYYTARFSLCAASESVWHTSRVLFSHFGMIWLQHQK